MGAVSETSEKMSKTISVRLPPELAEKMEEKSESSPYDIPDAEIVRAALREHLEE